MGSWSASEWPTVQNHLAHFTTLRRGRRARATCSSVMLFLGSKGPLIRRVSRLADVGRDRSGVAQSEMSDSFTERVR